MDSTTQSLTATNWWETPWFVAIVIGAIVLGAVIAYGALHNRRLTRDEKQQTARGTQQLYEREDRDEDQRV